MNRPLRSLCIYCGSAPGVQPLYADMARALGRAMVRQNIALVYGGGSVGLMGIIADAVMRQGGSATGVIPQILMDKEVGHHGLTALHVVKDMHERKAMMAELSDGFIAMPGGFGTLEELFEILTWAQLGLHTKPIGLLNVNGYYDGLISFIDYQVAQGFLKPIHAARLLPATQPDVLLEKMAQATPPAGELDQSSAQELLQ